MKKTNLFLSFALFYGVFTFAADTGVSAPAAISEKADTIQLPTPSKDGGMPLMKALSERKTVRDFKPGKMELQTLSDLLYSAVGVNRPDGKRTIPTAMNMQDIEVYAILQDAAYHYNAQSNKLEKITDGDHRVKAMQQQNFGANAACVLIYVSDNSKHRNANEERFALIHVGSASQNVYLYCASRGYATVSVAMFREDELRKILKLSNKQTILLAQPVGFLPASPDRNPR